MKRTLSLLIALAAAAQVAVAQQETSTTDPTLASSAATATDATQVVNATDPLATTPIPEENLAKITQATENRNALGVFFDVNVGTQGVGFNLGYEFNRYLKLRFRAAWLSYTYNTDWEDADVEAKLNGNNSGILLDVHPFAGKFRVSAGVNFNPLSVEADATMKNGALENLPEKTYTWGGYDYVVKQVDGEASVHAQYKWRTAQPYLGIGWASDGDGDRSLYFSFDLGVNFMGSGNFSISTSGAQIWQKPAGAPDDQLKPVDNALLRDSVKEEGKDFFKIADKIYVYPVLQIGMGYRF